MSLNDEGFLLQVGEIFLYKSNHKLGTMVNDFYIIILLLGYFIAVAVRMSEVILQVASSCRCFQQ